MFILLVSNIVVLCHHLHLGPVVEHCSIEGLEDLKEKEGGAGFNVLRITEISHLKCITGFRKHVTKWWVWKNIYEVCIREIQFRSCSQIQNNFSKGTIRNVDNNLYLFL